MSKIFFKRNLNPFWTLARVMGKQFPSSLMTLLRVVYCYYHTDRQQVDRISVIFLVHFTTNPKRLKNEKTIQ